MFIHHIFHVDQGDINRAHAHYDSVENSELYYTLASFMHSFQRLQSVSTVEFNPCCTPETNINDTEC